MSKQLARSKKTAKKTSKKSAARTRKKDPGRQDSGQDTMDELLRQRFWDTFHDLAPDQRKPPGRPMDLDPLLRRLSDLFPEGCQVHHLWPPFVTMATIDAGTDLPEDQQAPTPLEWEEAIVPLARQAMAALAGMQKEYAELSATGKDGTTRFLLKHGFVSRCDELTEAMLREDLEQEREVERRKSALAMQPASDGLIWFGGQHHVREEFVEELRSLTQSLKRRRDSLPLPSARDGWAIASGKFYVWLQDWRRFERTAQALQEGHAAIHTSADLSKARARERRLLWRQLREKNEKSEESEKRRPMSEDGMRSEVDRILYLKFPFEELASQWVEMRVWQARFQDDRFDEIVEIPGPTDKSAAEATPKSPRSGQALTPAQKSFIIGAREQKTSIILDRFEERFGFRISDRTVRKYRNQR